MNITKTPTSKKVAFPLRLPPDMYKKIRKMVSIEHDKGNYKYSTNDCLTQIIENGINMRGDLNGKRSK